MEGQQACLQQPLATHSSWYLHGEVKALESQGHSPC